MITQHLSVFVSGACSTCGCYSGLKHNYETRSPCAIPTAAEFGAKSSSFVSHLGAIYSLEIATASNNWPCAFTLCPCCCSRGAASACE